MRISKEFALIMVSVLALACGHAAAAESKPKAEFLDKQDQGSTADDAKKGTTETKPTTSQPASQQPTTEGGKGLWGGNKMLFIMLGGVFLLYIFMGRSKRKQAAKRKEMLASLKKGAKVTTIGGIVGTVVEVREDEVTVKVDETNNSRLRLARWAIRGVGEEAKTERPDQKK